MKDFFKHSRYWLSSIENAAEMVNRINHNNTTTEVSPYHMDCRPMGTKKAHNEIDNVVLPGMFFS